MNKQIKNWKSPKVSYLEEIDENLTYHLYCNYHYKTKEVFRFYADGRKYVRDNIWHFNYVAGYKPTKYWDEKGNSKINNRWYPWGLSGFMPNVDISKRVYASKKKLIKLIPQLKYVDADCLDKRNCYYAFLLTLKEHPEMELIYKNPYLHDYWGYKSLYKLKKKELCKLANMIEYKDREDLSEKNLLKMIYLMRHPDIRTEEQWENIKWLHRAKRVDNYYGDYKELAMYLKKQWNSHNVEERCGYIRYTKENMVSEYKDYLSLCEKLGIYEAFFPRDLLDSISVLSKKVKKKEQKQPLLNEEKLNKYIGLLPNNKKLELVIPNTGKELIKIGNEMDNCVGSCDFDERVKEGKSLIVVGKVEGKSVECCEIDLKQMKIQQLYSKSNKTDGEYHKLARVLINRFIREIRA